MKHLEDTTKSMRQSGARKSQDWLPYSLIGLGVLVLVVVLVNSWATWCPPCKAEMPDLNAYYQAHQQEGFVVLAINAGDPASEAADFAINHALAFPVLLDLDMRVLEGFNIHDYPTSIVIDRKGRVQKIHIGMYRPEELEADITPLLTQ